MSDLAAKVELRERQLEEKPESWFEEPSGWLSKPDFKRKEQKLAAYKDGKKPGSGMMGSIMKKGYSRRFFVLNGMALEYYREIDATTPAGAVSLSDVLSVETSIVNDAPANSIDLRTADHLYTLAADSEVDMINWAVAVTSIIKNKGAGKTKGAGAAGGEGGEAEAVNWQRFDQTFPTKQPLLLNVKGVANRNDLQQVTNHWIVVTGFAKSKDGSPGPAQACEKIKAMDIIVGCNGVDLTELTFNECMSVIRHADWPKTLHFIRDPSTANAVPVIKEGWTKFGVAGAGNAHRRRYLEVKEGDIFYFKPTPGGAISKDPDGNVQLVMVETFSKIMDRTTTEDEQFQIKILFKDASKLPVVIACASAEDMDEWADALCKAQPDGFGDAAAKGVTTLESEDLEKGAVAVDDLLLFDDLGGTFKQQRFVLTEGGDNGPELRLGPRVLGLGMPGGQSTVLSLKQIVAPKCASVEPIGAGHQLLIDTLESTLIVGLPDQQTALKWVDALVKAISRCKPQPEMVVGPGAVVIEDWDPASKNAAQQESAAADNRLDAAHLEEIECDHCGYMHKRGDAKSALGSIKFRERFFVLKGSALLYFKTGAQALGDTPTGTIDLKEVHEVRPSKDPASPDLAIDVATSTRVYVLVPPNEESRTRWMAVLKEAVDSFADEAYVTGKVEVADQSATSILRRASLKPSGSSGEASSDPTAAAATAEAASVEGSAGSVSGDGNKRAMIKASIKKDGYLHKKTDNRMTGAVTWKKRYFCLSQTQLAYYETELDLYSEDADPLGAISMHQVQEVKTSTDPKVAEAGTGIEVKAKLGKEIRADEEGTRVYVLEASTPAEAKEWMEIICSTCGRLKLNMESPGVYKSEVSADSDTRRLQQLNKQTNVYKANSGGNLLGGGRGRRATTRGGRGGRLNRAPTATANNNGI